VGQADVLPSSLAVVQALLTQAAFLQAGGVAVHSEAERQQLGLAGLEQVPVEGLQVPAVWHWS
jgi:hypothetical protein